MCLSATSPSQTYTLSLHDALPISAGLFVPAGPVKLAGRLAVFERGAAEPFKITPERTTVGGLRPERWLPGVLVPGPCEARDRKSTRLNSSHLVISYACFCLKKTTM